VDGGFHAAGLLFEDGDQTGPRVLPEPGAPGKGLPREKGRVT
jgi:hypothetical protein